MEPKFNSKLLEFIQACPEERKMITPLHLAGAACVNKKLTDVEDCYLGGLEANAHIGLPEAFKGNDDYGVSGILGWTGRGSLIAIPVFFEEVNPLAAVCLGFHKGDTLVWLIGVDVELTEEQRTTFYKETESFCR